MTSADALSRPNVAVRAPRRDPIAFARAIAVEIAGSLVGAPAPEFGAYSGEDHHGNVLRRDPGVHAEVFLAIL